MKVYIVSLGELESSACTASRAVEQIENGRRNANADDLAAGLLMHSGLGLDDECATFVDAAGASIESAPFFCVSRGGSYAAAVVSDYGYIGIDIEQIMPRDIQDNQLHDEEHEWLSKRTNRDQSFAALWTAKESLRKAADAALSPASYSILPVSRSWHVAAQGSWFLHWKRLDGHMLCVCSMKPETLEIHRLGPDRTEV